MGPHEALAKAVKLAGGQVKLAEQIGTTQSNISFWSKASKLGVRAEFVLPIERATGVSRHHLRPDLYPATETEAAA